MPAPAMRSVYSSHVNTIGYDDEASELWVQWQSGKMSVYSGVPADMAQSVMDAPSVGSALHDRIKGAFAHKYV